jgi:diguanylate cyclase (GGDEF)-like protein/PAS domain S-box-containing protein
MSSRHIPFAQIVESASDIIVVTTADLDLPGPVIVYVNAAFTRLTGYAAADVIGHTPRILQGIDTDQVTLRAIRTALKKGEPVHQTVLNYSKTGSQYWLDLRIVALRDATNAITHFAAIQRDVTADKRRFGELELAALRDSLTGIPNRRAFVRAVHTAVTAAEMRTASGQDFKGPSIAFIDVDHFKRINDQLGHAAGDEILLGVANRLTASLRRGDTLGRLGGEEFAVCMPSAPLEEAQVVGERLRQVVEESSFDSLAGLVRATVSIGVTTYKTGDSLERMMSRADAAMYSAKRAGRNQVILLRD